MSRLSVIALLLLLSFRAGAQLQSRFDTLTLNTRMNSLLDSIDVSGSLLPTTFDGGVTVLSPAGLTAGTLFRQYTQPVFSSRTDFRRMAFSALPYLGFSYTFGGQGSQFLKARYVQAFRDSTILNIVYDRKSGNGLLRNSAFVGNDLRVQLQHKGRVYSTKLIGSYVSNDVAHSGGLTTDTLIGVYDLEFLPVYRTNAHSKSKLGYADWYNYIDVLKDSSRALGPLIHHRYAIENRVYTEAGTLTDLYSSIYIDSTNTRDQWNLASLANGAGLYYAGKHLFADLSGDYVYWKYQNLGVHYDSVEVDLRSNIRWESRRWLLSNQVKANLLGRYGEFFDRLQANYSHRNVTAGLWGEYALEAPDNWQRRYLANSVFYAMTTPSVQQWFRVRGNFNIRLMQGKLSLGATADMAQISKVYVFNGQEWTNDSVQTTLFTGGVTAALDTRIFHVHTRMLFGQDSKGYLPAAQLYARIFVKGKLFKAKKLEAMAGIDGSYISSYRTRAYLPVMDTYDWFSSTSTFQPVANLHAFVSLGISEFRFFVRYENFGALWWDPKNQEVENYPMATGRLRIGLTWDFFN